MKRLGIIICTLALMVISVVPTFAAEKSNLNPNAAYEITNSAGQSIVPKFDYTHCEFVDFPKDGDTIKIWYDGNKNKQPDEVGIYGTKDKNTGFFRNDGSRILYNKIGREGKDYDIKNNTVSLRFHRSDSVSAYTYNISQNIKVQAFTPAIERIEYCFSTLIVKPEDVAIYEDGKRYLTMWARESHYYNGMLIESPFCPGESVKVYFSNGTSKTYYCQDVTTSWGLLLAGFVANDGDTLLLDVIEPVDGVFLREGDNDVKVVIADRNDVDPFMLKVFVGEKAPESTPAPTATAAPKVQNNVLNVATASKVKVKRSGKKMTVRWKKATKKQQKEFGKYEVQYSNNRDFVNAKTKYIKKSKNSCTIKQLNKKQVYYVRMRKIKDVNGQTYVSKWSKIKKAKK